MVGAHRAGGSAAEMKDQIREIIFNLNQQITALTMVKADTRTAATKILALETRNNDVMIAGGTLLNNAPQMIDELIRGYQLHIRNLEIYMNETL